MEFIEVWLNFNFSAEYVVRIRIIEISDSITTKLRTSRWCLLLYPLHVMINFSCRYKFVRTEKLFNFDLNEGAF